MMQELESLSKEEYEIILNSPILVCILIAGADDDIDNNEVSKAIAMAKENSKASRAHLFEFYKEVANDFESKLSSTIKALPAKASERDPVIINKLNGLNHLLGKIDKTFAIVLYASLKELAVKVAKSSGGVMGINAISKEEAKYVELPMLKDPAQLFG